MAVFPDDASHAGTRGSPFALGAKHAETSHDKRAAMFVFSVWAVILLGRLILIALYARSVPFIEDWWLWVPHVTGHEPFTLEWLWRAGEGGAVLEHREPLFKLLMYSLVKLGHGDFRVPILFSTLAVGGLSFAMIQVARRVRGNYAYSDAFLAIAVMLFDRFALNANNAIGFLSSTLVAGVILMVMALHGTRLTLRSGIIAGLALLCLPLCGPYGMVNLPGVGIWYMMCVICSWRTRESDERWNALIFFNLGLLALLLALSYLQGIGLSQGASRPKLNESLKFAIATFAASLGDATRLTWPWSAWIMAFYASASALTLMGVARFQRGLERSRAIALLAFFVAAMTLALVLGWGRVLEYGLAGAWQYYLFPVPLACLLYFAWFVARPRALGRAAQIGLFCVSLVTLPLNVRITLDYCHDELARVGDFVKDLRAGVPMYQLLARHHMALKSDLPEDREMEFYRWLAEARMGPFRYLKDDPPLREIDLDPRPSRTNRITWTEGVVAHGFDGTSWLEYRLPEPMYVAAVTMDTQDVNNLGYDNCCVYVYNSQAGEQPARPLISWTRGLSYIAIAKTIDTIRIQPSDRKSSLWVKRLSALVPEGGEPMAP